jgi:hypothetical protein
MCVWQVLQLCVGVRACAHGFCLEGDSGAPPFSSDLGAPWLPQRGRKAGRTRNYIAARTVENTIQHSQTLFPDKVGTSGRFLRGSVCSCSFRVGCITHTTHVNSDLVFFVAFACLYDIWIKSVTMQWGQGLGFTSQSGICGVVCNHSSRFGLQTNLADHRLPPTCETQLPTVSIYQPIGHGVPIVVRPLPKFELIAGMPHWLLVFSGRRYISPLGLACTTSFRARATLGHGLRHYGPRGRVNRGQHFASFREAKCYPVLTFCSGFR